jgi:hypothetical protein
MRHILNLSRPFCKTLSEEHICIGLEFNASKSEVVRFYGFHCDYQPQSFVLDDKVIDFVPTRRYLDVANFVRFKSYAFCAFFQF